MTGTNDTERAVLAAFAQARAAGWDSAECYAAGVAAWRQRHPDHQVGYAAKQAVAVILAAHSHELLSVE